MPIKIALLSFILFGLTFQQKGVLLSQRDFKGVIFPSNFDVLTGFSDVSDPGHVTPSKEMIVNMEKQLGLQIRKLTADAPNQGRGLGPVIHRNLSKYFRQYVGLTDDKGNRYILINFVWAKSGVFDDKDALTDWIQVYDGGSNYWNIKFNLSTKTFYDAQVNGVA